MPRRDFHDIWEKLMFGTVTGITAIMDAPEEFLHGQHQTLNHTPQEVMLIAMSMGGNTALNYAAG